MSAFIPFAQASNPNSSRNNGQNGENSDSNSRDFINPNQPHSYDLDILSPDDVFIDINEIVDDSPSSPDILGADEEVVGINDDSVDESLGEGFIPSRERNGQGRIIGIGKALKLSPSFPRPHTVHATFTAHGVPTKFTLYNYF